MIEFHGNLFSTICSKEKVKVDIDVAVPNNERNTAESLKIPSCPQCGALIRPGVVWFGEVRNPPHSLTCNRNHSLSYCTPHLLFPVALLAFYYSAHPF